jgi:hypothetical protein
MWEPVRRRASIAVAGELMVIVSAMVRLVRRVVAVFQEPSLSLNHLKHHRIPEQEVGTHHPSIEFIDCWCNYFVCVYYSVPMVLYQLFPKTNSAKICLVHIKKL